MTETMIKKINQFICKEITKSETELKADEPIISNGVIDSFSLVDLAMFIEDEFGVEIDDTELNAETFDTLDQLVSLIKERMD